MSHPDPERGERVVHVAEIIRDFWPHRMSSQAAAAIDDYYLRLSLQSVPPSTVSGELRVGSLTMSPEGIKGTWDGSSVDIRTSPYQPRHRA